MGYYLGEDGKRHRKTVSKSFTRRRDAVNALPAIGISKVSAKSEKKAKTTFKKFMMHGSPRIPPHMIQ